MALQLGALRDALLEAGASPEKADKAAEELAGYESRLLGIEARLDGIAQNMASKADLADLRTEVRTELAEVRTELVRMERRLIAFMIVIGGAALTILHYWPRHG